MMTKESITGNWLVRYTQMPLEQFGDYVLLTNFNNYVDLFCEQCGVPPVGFGANMRAATASGITMINFGMGSPNAALIMDLLGAVRPKACLFLGKCGGISSRPSTTPSRPSRFAQRSYATRSCADTWPRASRSSTGCMGKSTTCSKNNGR